MLLNMLHQSKEEERQALVENVASLVSLLRQHLRKWLPELLHLIHIFWTSDSQLQVWLLKLISELAGKLSLPCLRRYVSLCTTPTLPVHLTGTAQCFCGERMLNAVWLCRVKRGVEAYSTGFFASGKSCKGRSQGCCSSAQVLSLRSVI